MFLLVEADGRCVLAVCLPLQDGVVTVQQFPLIPRAPYVSNKAVSVVVPVSVTTAGVPRGIPNLSAHHSYSTNTKYI